MDSNPTRVICLWFGAQDSGKVPDITIFISVRVKTMGDYWDAWWQQTYQVKPIVLGHVCTLRTT